jgi:hypothetical protein
MFRTKQILFEENKDTHNGGASMAENALRKEVVVKIQ